MTTRIRAKDIIVAAAARLLGRQSGSAGVAQEIDLGANLALTGTTLSANGTGAFGLSAVISPSAISGGVTDWNPAGLSTANTIRIAVAGSSPIIYSILGGTAGRILVLVNTDTTYQTYISHDDGFNGTASSRFLTGGNQAEIPPQNACILQYDGTSSRWRILCITALATINHPGFVRTLDGDSNHFLDGTGYFSKPVRPLSVPFNCIAITASTWVAFPNSDDFLFNNPRHVQGFVDLTGYTEYKLVVNTGSSIATSGNIYLRYWDGASGARSNTITDYLDLQSGTSGIDITTAADDSLTTGWQSMDNPIGECSLAIVGNNGTGVENPNFANIIAYFR